MKKLLLLLSAVFCLALVGCSNANNTDNNSGNSGKQEYQNNTTDEHFSRKENVTYYYTEIYYETDIEGSWSTVLVRTEGTTGVVGTWKRRRYGEYPSQNYEEYTSFKDDGTYEKVGKKSSGDEITEGTYEVSKEGDDFIITIHWSSHVYKLKYLVSDSYFCHEAGTGCPI